MKRLVVILAGAMMYTLMAGSAFAANGSCNDWNFAMEYLRASEQPQAVIPDLCGTPRWYFMDSGDLTHTPSKYTLLTTPNSYTAAVPGTGLKWWGGTSSYPAVFANASNEVQIANGYLEWKPATAFVHPSPTSAAIVGWKSTFNGEVQMEVNLGDLDTNCGDGQTWYIQKGNTVLASGAIPIGGSTNWLHKELSVRAGDFLYVGVGPGPNGDYYCDTTNLDITVTRLP
jgi:hypothetical protein